jgi:hypothetical protein
MEIIFETTKIVVVLSFFILIAFSLFITIKYSKHNKFLYFVIPLILILSSSTYKTIEDLLGYPTTSYVSVEQLYLDHLIGAQEQWIYIWAATVEDEYIPRSYKIPYTKEDEKKLNEAKERKEGGLPQAIKLKEDEAILFIGKRAEITLKLYDFDKMKGVTKNE